MHHWAHIAHRSCDPWWENETSWHRQWKSYFPEECREVVHVAGDGEIHRADIKTNTGIYIEVQHSAISDSERISRESFYRNLIWVVDGRSFAHNFHIYYGLPDPNCEFARDLVWVKTRKHLHGSIQGVFYRLSESRAHGDGVCKSNLKTGGMVEIHGRHKIEGDVMKHYRGHHQYDWTRPRKTWLDATCPVFIDFGNEFVKMQAYDEPGLLCIRRVSKKQFVCEVSQKLFAAEVGI
jgi:competence protein CoiA